MPNLRQAIPLPESSEKRNACFLIDNISLRNKTINGEYIDESFGCNETQYEYHSK